MIRHCISSTLSVQHWKEKFELDHNCIEELRLWRTNLNSLTRFGIVSSFTRLVYSDASATGFDSVILLGLEIVLLSNIF